MKQLLIDVVEFLKEEYEMNMSDISKDLGKGRNFISEAINRGYKDEEQYLNLFNKIEYQFFCSDDYVKFYAFLNKKHQAKLHKSETAGDKAIDSLHEKIKSMEEKNQDLFHENVGYKDRIVEEISKNKLLEHRITMLNKNIDAHEAYRKKVMPKNHELSAENNKLNMYILDLQKYNQSYKSKFEAQENAIKKLKNDLALQESLFLEQDLELRKYKKLADGKEEQVQACFRALSSSKKEKSYLFGGFMLLSVLVLVILYLSFMHIKI